MKLQREFKEIHALLNAKTLEPKLKRTAMLKYDIIQPQLLKY